MNNSWTLLGYLFTLHNIALVGAATCSMAKVSNMFKLIPKSIEDITVDWCDEVLHKQNCISQDVQVSSVSVQNLTNDSEMSNGGGLSGSTMLKVKLTYRSVNS